MANVVMKKESSLKEDMVKAGESLTDRANGVVIADHEACHQVDKMISETVRRLKAIDEYWADTLEIIKKNLALTRGKKKDMERGLVEAQKILCDKLFEWKQGEGARHTQAVEAKAEANKKAGLEAALKMAEEGQDPDAVKAMTELAMSDEGIEVHNFEVKTRNTLEPDWKVELIKGEEHKVPAKWLVPTTEAARKAIAQTIKTEVVAKRGQMAPIPGVRIVSTYKSIKRG